MDLKVLGCATPFPTHNNPCSGYLLSGDSSTLLLDCGSGVFASLLEALDPNELSGVWISHLHPDHFADMPAMANWALNTSGAKKFPVYGPQGWDRRLNHFLSGDPDSGLSGKIFEVGYIVDGDSIQLGGLSLHSRSVRHSVTAYGVRVAGDGVSFAYSGDTGPCATLSELASKVDLLLCEAGASSPAEYHLTPQQAYEVAVAAGVGELVLTHIPGGPSSVELNRPDTEKPLVGVARPGDRRLVGRE